MASPAWVLISNGSCRSLRCLSRLASPGAFGHCCSLLNRHPWPSSHRCPDGLWGGVQDTLQLVDADRVRRLYFVHATLVGLEPA